MPRLHPVSARELDRLLKRLGFQPTTVPQHQGRDLAVPLLRAIISDVRISTEEFLRRLSS